MPLRFWVRPHGYSALVEHHRWCGIDLFAGRSVEVWSNLDRQVHHKGEKGIIRRIRYDRFWHYENCWVGIYFPIRKETFWFDANCCDYSKE